MGSQFMPLGFGELGTPPVVEPGGVLTTECDAERLGRRALRRSDVRLELHGIGARGSDRIDERMSQTEASVVSEGDLPHDETRFAEQRCRHVSSVANSGAPVDRPD